MFLHQIGKDCFLADNAADETFDDIRYNAKEAFSVNVTYHLLWHGGNWNSMLINLVCAYFLNVKLRVT